MNVCSAYSSTEHCCLEYRDEYFVHLYDAAGSAPFIIIHEHQKQLAEAVARSRADLLAAVIAECKRKQALNDKSDKGIGHSAQSFGQHWAYGELIEWCKAQQAPGEEK